MSLPIRYSPSGAVIATLASGARLRLTETAAVITGPGPGTINIPAAADASSVICTDGFGGASAIVLTLANPLQANQYRAELELDVINTSTNVEGQVVLYLDTSVDGGTTWTNRAKVAHLIDAQNEAGATNSESRPMAINLVLTTGQQLGCVDGTTTSLKLRARANLPVGTAGAVKVDSPAASGGGGSAVTGLQGTFHAELEECLGA